MTCTQISLPSLTSFPLKNELVPVGRMLTTTPPIFVNAAS